MTDADPSGFTDGDTLTVGCRMFMFSNPALNAYYVIDVPMFVHTFEDTGETVLLAEADWMETADDAGKIETFIDGVPADVDHPRIEYIRQRD